MATAKQLPSGSWRCQVYAGKDPLGKRQYLSFTAHTQKEAELQALQWQLRYKEISRDSTAMTLQEAMERYIESKNNVLSPSTLRGYTTMSRQRLQRLMPVKLNRLTNPLIQQVLNAEAETASPKYIRNLHGLLSAVLKEYYPSFHLNVTLPQKEIHPQQFLEPEQIGVLLRAIRGTDMEIPILLGLWLGMRSSEITGLTWEDVDFQHRTVFIHRAKVRNTSGQWVVKNTTKNLSSSRTLHIPDHLLDLLRFAKGESSPADPVVPLEGHRLYQKLQTILKQNALPPIRFHDLRHTFASSCAALGVPPAYTQRLGGWSAPNTMNQVYTHIMTSQQQAIHDNIDHFFLSLMG